MGVFWKLLGTAAVVAGAAYAGKKFIDKHNVEVNITPADDEEEDCVHNVTFDDAEHLGDDDEIFSDAPISSEYTYSIGKHVTVRVENPVEMEDYEEVPEEEIEIEFTGDGVEISVEEESGEKKDQPAPAAPEEPEAAEEV